MHLAGWQSDTSQYYANNDILVSSSIYESFGLTFVEAAYFSLPVVATNVEGIPEVVIHNQTGLLCEPNDPSALAQNLIKMIENPQLRREFGEQNRKRCMECFSVQKMVSQYLDFYNSAK